MEECETRDPPSIQFVKEICGTSDDFGIVAALT